MKYDIPSYSDYRRWGHTRFTSFVLSKSSLWWFTSAVIVGVLIGLLFVAIPAYAFTVTNDEGGYTAAYHRNIKALAKKGERIVIDGPCYSACTLVFTYIPLSRICVTPRAVFGFHRFRYENRNGHISDDPAATNAAFSHYPKPVRDYINSRGGVGALPAPGFLYLRGEQTGLKRC